MAFRLYAPGERRGNSSYYAKVSVNGLTREVCTHTTDRAEATEYAEAVELDLYHRTVVGSNARKTVSDAIDDYVGWRRPRLNDQCFLERLKYFFGETPVWTVDQKRMDRACLELYPNRATSTWARQVFTPMSAALNHAGVPIRFRKPPQPRHTNRFVSVGVAETLIAECDDQDLKALLIFLFFTGARLSEALSLKPDQVDFENRRARLSMTKQGKVAWRPLHDRVLWALADLPAREDRVFRWATTRGPDKALRRLRMKTGIYFTFHMARHSFATWLTDDGASLKDVMDAGGWKSVKSVIRYVGSNEERVRNAISRL